jgi:hypothetical protein
MGKPSDQSEREMSGIRLHRWGAETATTDRDAGLDYTRRERFERAEVEGFTDASELLASGVFLLALRGTIVYVGKASGPMLAKLAATRSASRPSCLPRIEYDQILIRKVHPDRLEATFSELTARYLIPSAPQPGAIIIERRI